MTWAVIPEKWAYSKLSYHKGTNYFIFSASVVVKNEKICADGPRSFTLIIHCCRQK